jgi:Phytanoyl-CoA dioxygenase (PhyH)
MNNGQLHTQAFWQAFAPGFHIADVQLFQNVPQIELPPQSQQLVADLVRVEGYVQASNANWGVDVAAMANLVRKLTENGLSTVFAFMYDEFWLPFIKLHQIYSNLLGGQYYVLPDFWVWNVDPKRGDAGWRPHRDKGYMALLPDGSPKSLTTWIPLSAATTLNGCMYLVPAMLDPTYGKENDKEWKFELPSVRALPGNVGDFFIWNQAVLHWGSRTSPRAPESRVSMAFEFQRADVAPFNQPLINPLSILTFDERLRLIAKQILQYKHMYKLEPNVEQFAQQLLAA